MNQRVRSGWSIRTRLLVLVVAIFVLFVALYAYSTQLAVEDASREVQTESMQLAQLLAANMDQFVACAGCWKRWCAVR